MKKETMLKIYDLRDFVKSRETVNEREQIISKINEILACEMNEHKIGKFDFYEICAPKEREVYAGVAHLNGYKYATDGRMLVKVKAEYPQELEGKMVLKDGSFAPDYVKFPNYDSVIPNIDGWKEFKVDFKKFAESKKMANVHWNEYKKNPEYRAIVNVNNEIHLNYWKFEKMLKLMKELDTDVVYYINSIRPVLVKGKESVCILMPYQFSENFEECHFVYSITNQE